MKSSKRITALLVAFVFVLTSVMSFGVFAADDITFTDLDATNPYYKAITSLVADGVINGYAEADGTSTFKPDNTITRAEFSKLLAVASAPAGYAFTAATTQFPDVADANAEEGWAIPYISYAVGIGAINGYEDGTFRPQNPVTYAEAVKMIVCTLGYGNVVDTTLNPWYQGYIDVANQIGLTKAAGSLPETNAVRGLVAQLIYNMGECKVYIGTTDGSGQEIKINTGNTGGTLNESETGILYGVFEYCLTGEDLTKQEVLIDDEIYQLGDYEVADLKDLVGYSVKFSITNDRKNTLSRVSKESGDNDTTTVEDWQIASVSGDEIEYYADEDAYDEDEVSTMKLANDFYVIYNGYVVDPGDIDDDFIEEYLDVTTGEIEFISNDGNAKTAEVAIVESYDLYHVKSVSTVNGITTFYDTNAAALKLDGGIAIDEDDAVDVDGESNVTKISSKNGSATESSLTAITKNSVVSVAVPYDSKEGTKLVISTVSFSGTVKELDDSYEYVKIGNDEYDVSPYFEAILDAGVDVEFETGDTAKFYLDHKGRIAYLEKTESSNPYGLIVAYASGSGVDSSYEIRLFTGNNKFLDYPLKDKVKINGDSYDADEAIDVLRANATKTDADNDKVIIQPVKYVTSTQNGKTVFSEFETIDKENPQDGNIIPYPIKNSNKDDKSEFAEDGWLTYSSSGRTFKKDDASQFTMSTSSVVFVVPSDLDDTTSYKKSTYSYFTNNGKYCVEPYDVESGSTANLVICYLMADQASSTLVTSTTPVAFIESIRDAENADKEPVKKVTYRVPGSSELKECFSANDTEVIDKLDTLESGDLAKFAIEDDEITIVEVVYTAGALSPETSKDGKFKNDNDNQIAKDYEETEDYYRVIMGTVSTINTDDLSVAINPAFVNDNDFNAEVWENFTWTTSTSLYDYDEKNDEFVAFDAEKLASYEDAGENASQVIIIVINKKIVAIYDLAE